jgi:hypothetical protein
MSRAATTHAASAYAGAAPKYPNVIRWWTCANADVDVVMRNVLGGQRELVL